MSYLGLTGAPEATDLMAAIAERASDMTPVLPVIYASFLVGEKDRFSAEGPGWAALAPSTVARKGFATILVETGQMRASLTSEGAEGAVKRIYPNRIEMGTDYRSPRQTGRWASVALASFHQFGTSKMPARPVIDADDPYIDGWAPVIADWVGAGIIAETVAIP